MGTKLFWNLKALPFLTILVLWQPNRQSLHYCISFAYLGIEYFVLPSVTRECNPKILELLYLLQCRSIHLQHALIRVSWRWSTSVLTVLLFILVALHASAKLLNARWRAGSVKESGTKSSANSRRLILQFLIEAHSSTWLHLSIQFMQTMKGIGDKTYPCRSPMPTGNDCDCLAFTRTQSSALQ